MKGSAAIIFAGVLVTMLGGAAFAAEAVRGVVRPRMQASISSDLAVPVARIGAKEGEAFKKGDTLVAFDCRRQEAEYEAAKAEHSEMEIAFDNAKYLSAHKAAGKLDVDMSRARVEKTAAQLAALSVRLAWCSIVAPFDGRVSEMSIREHETPMSGKPLLTIVETGKPEIELIVPSTWLRWLSQGYAFTFQIDETGLPEKATVARIGAAVDPVSQTIKVSGEFATPSANILPGMSGTADFGLGGN